jgi:hypothetical protein
MKRGQQPLVITPGKNQKQYLAGALNARTGSLAYKCGERKNSTLFAGIECDRKTLEADARPCYSEPSAQDDGIPDAGNISVLKGGSAVSGDQGFDPDHGGMKRVSNQLQAI